MYALYAFYGRSADASRLSNSVYANRTRAGKFSATAPLPRAPRTNEIP